MTLPPDEIERRKESFRKRRQAFAALDRAGLLGALDVFAKNWLAHDGSWFLAAEERFGMDVAMDLDAEAWRRFAAAEARRILEAHGIPKDGDLGALACLHCPPDPEARGICGWEFRLSASTPCVTE